MRVTNLLSLAVKCLQPPDPHIGSRSRARHILSVPVLFLTGNEPCMDVDYYLAPWISAKYRDERFCVCVCQRAYLKTTCPNTTKLSTTCHRCSVILWRHCDTFCTSGCVDDVVFAHNRPRSVDVSNARIQSKSSGVAPDRARSCYLRLHIRSCAYSFSLQSVGYKGHFSRCSTSTCRQATA